MGLSIGDLSSAGASSSMTSVMIKLSRRFCRFLSSVMAALVGEECSSTCNSFLVVVALPISLSTAAIQRSRDSRESTANKSFVIVDLVLLVF